VRDIKAAVVRHAGGPFSIENLQLDDPRPDEIIVRIVATGMCHSDLVAKEQLWPVALPVVLGHEGAGIVEQIGSAVEHVAVGDPVVLTFNSCGRCHSCEDGHKAYCSRFGMLNASGAREDGSGTLGSGVHGCFFYQSSFATFALAHARNVVKVRADAPLEVLGPLGCGIQTGAGAVLNVLKPSASHSFAVFGAGAVGLSGMLGAKILGCQTIIVVDRVASRLQLARELGATHVIDAGSEDAVEAIRALGGVDMCLEASGVPTVAAQAVRSLRDRGTCALVGAYPPGSTIPLDISELAPGKVIRQIVEGDVDPHRFIPELIEHLLAGQLPLERLVRMYTLDQINEAAEDSMSGRTIKPIIRMTH